MKIRSVVNSLDALTGSRIRKFLNPPPPPYRSDLSDTNFIAKVSQASEPLFEVGKRYAEGDEKTAKTLLVDHFIGRKIPKFLCDVDQIRPLAEAIEQHHPEWARSLRDLVKDDLELGLRIMSRRDAPLAELCSWAPFPAGPGGDSLYRAQPHRFGFLPGLALVNYYGMPTLDLITSLIDGWIDATNAGEEESYHSPLSVTQRVLSLSWAFFFIAGLGKDGIEHRVHLLFQILKILHADTEFLAGEIGDSYPNNHLLADGFIGWFCGTLFPEFPRAIGVKEDSEKLYLQQLKRQFLDDGANFEHSLHYHEMGCETAVVYVVLSRLNGVEPAPEILARLRNMLSFQVAIAGPDCVPIPFGDATEDPLFTLDTNRGWASGAMREFYRALFDANIPSAPASDPTVERAYWLCRGDLSPATSTDGDTLPTAFPKGGIYILDDAQREARLVFRSGPDEEQTLMAGHAHTDLLNVYVSVRGVPVIVDPGTYTYRFKSSKWPAGSPNWRAYFAGPDSHNGLITGEDAYGKMVSDFRLQELTCWVATNRDVTVPGLRWLEFEVKGTTPSLGHRRGVVHACGQYWLIYDLLPDGMKGENSAISLQFAQTMEISKGQARTALLSADDVCCRVSLSPGFEAAEYLTGSLDPLGGWVSPRYGEIAAAPQLRAKTTGEKQRPYGFVIQADPAGTTACEIDDCMTADSWVGFQIQNGPTTEFILIRTTDSSDTMAAWDVEYDGDLLWLQTVSGKVQDCRHSGGDAPRYKGQSVTKTSDNGPTDIPAQSV